MIVKNWERTLDVSRIRFDVMMIDLEEELNNGSKVYSEEETNGAEIYSEEGRLGIDAGQEVRGSTADNIEPEPNQIPDGGADSPNPNNP
jgi:hypothetical protein